jgi:uncharacterized membrane protein YfcA
MSAAELLVLAAAGVAGGLFGSVAGLASLATYPALLASGLAPVTANVTNTVALVFSSVGSVTASRPELHGQRRRVRRLALAAIVGGATGGALLLVTPADSFEKVVPWLLGMASLAILIRRPLLDASTTDAHMSAGGPRLALAVGLVGVYGGYFGAGAGVMLLALLLFVTGDSMPRSNAVKNVVLGLANGVAAVAFVVFGPVHWAAVVPLGAGLYLGGRLGPVIVRRAPARPLRITIALAGVALAVKLGADAYA